MVLKAACADSLACDFSLDDYLSYLIDFMHYIGPNTHVMAVCQPAVQVMALAAVMDEANDPCMPATIIPMGGPIDPRANKTQVNEFAESYSLKWFENNMLTFVPEGHVGAGRRVYPGFIQITALQTEVSPPTIRQSCGQGIL